MSKSISPDKKYPNKRFWLYIKGHRQEYSGTPTINANGCTLSEDSAKANALNAQFASVFTREDTSVIPNLSGTAYPINEANQCSSGGCCFSPCKSGSK